MHGLFKCSCLALATVLGGLGARPAFAQSLARTSVAQTAQDASRAPAYSIAVRLTPPLGAWGYTNPTRDAGLGVSLGGVGAGLITSQGLWFEGAFRLLRGLETGGSDVTALAGLAAGREVAPGNWDFSVPVYGGYRFANRPAASPSDGYPLTEKVHFLVAGTRAVWTRHYRSMALELSLAALAGLPISATPPASAYYSDPPTRSWIEGSALVGWVFDG